VLKPEPLRRQQGLDIHRFNADDLEPAVGQALLDFYTTSHDVIAESPSPNSSPLVWTVVADRSAILSDCCRIWLRSWSTGSTRPTAGS